MKWRFGGYHRRLAARCSNDTNTFHLVLRNKIRPGFWSIFSVYSVSQGFLRRPRQFESAGGPGDEVAVPSALTAHWEFISAW